jgi:putative ABC transport system ATP-binding protein
VPTAATAVRARNLWRVYGEGDARVEAVRDVSLDVARGEFLALVGRSGSGKSTLLHLLGTLDRPESGEIELGGELVTSLPDIKLALLRRRRIGFVLQFFNLLPTLTTIENAAFPLLMDGAPGAIDRAAAALDAVGLEHRHDHLPSQLSGGEQQRVALARALVTRPALILADEPTGNLDSATSREILALLRRTADSGETIMMVTHDEQAAATADRVVRIADGRLVEDGGGGGPA